MLVRCCNMISPITLTSSYFQKLQTKKTEFKYPSSPNELWVNAKCILCVIKESTFVGKTKGTVKMTQITGKAIQRKLEKLL